MKSGIGTIGGDGANYTETSPTVDYEGQPDITAKADETYGDYSPTPPSDWTGRKSPDENGRNQSGDVRGKSSGDGIPETVVHGFAGEILNAPSPTFIPTPMQEAIITYMLQNITGDDNKVPSQKALAKALAPYDFGGDDGFLTETHIRGLQSTLKSLNLLYSSGNGSYINDLDGLSQTIGYASYDDFCATIKC
jgi:hypothetical protein